jgi:hypothetical protein
MADEWLYAVDIRVILLSSIILFLGATEAGFRLGRWAQTGVNEGSRAEISTLQGAMLGLLALLLGFTFAMAMSRFDTRKQLILEESNAIGTAFLRAQLLPQPPRQEISHLLRQYVDVRLALYAAGINEQKLEHATNRTEALHKQLWSLAVAVGEKDPRAVTTGLFLQSLNEMIDLHAIRITALENHVPEIILMLLYFVAFVVTGVIGYGCGLTGCRNFLVTAMASILIASVILVIVDLDRPRRGLIQVSQARMVELRQSLANY